MTGQDRAGQETIDLLTRAAAHMRSTASEATEPDEDYTQADIDGGRVLLLAIAAWLEATARTAGHVLRAVGAADPVRANRTVGHMAHHEVAVATAYLRLQEAETEVPGGGKSPDLGTG